MSQTSEPLSPEREAVGLAIACRYLDEHGDPCDWCQATTDAYVAEIAAAGTQVAR